MVDRAAVEEIRRAVRETGRGITVVAAAKTRAKEEIDELMRLAPEFVLGENRVQEFMSAYDPAYRWHFIGQLQTNKVKYLAGKVELIHSLDRHELAREIERRSERAGVVQDCLVEVNMGSEISKGGVEPGSAIEFIRELAAYPHIRVRGLMSVLPALGDTPELRRLYADLAALFEEAKKLPGQGGDIAFLSAGMTGDWHIALEYGANIIRLGRAIFGERVYPAAAI